VVESDAATAAPVLEDDQPLASESVFTDPDGDLPRPALEQDGEPLDPESGSDQ